MLSIVGLGYFMECVLGSIGYGNNREAMGVMALRVGVGPSRTPSIHMIASIRYNVASIQSIQRRTKTPLQHNLALPWHSPCTRALPHDLITTMPPHPPSFLTAIIPQPKTPARSHGVMESLKTQKPIKTEKKGNELLQTKSRTRGKGKKKSRNNPSSTVTGKSKPSFVFRTARKVLVMDGVYPVFGCEWLVCGINHGRL